MKLLIMLMRTKKRSLSLSLSLSSWRTRDYRSDLRDLFYQFYPDEASRPAAGDVPAGNFGNCLTIDQTNFI